MAAKGLGKLKGAQKWVQMGSGRAGVYINE